MRSAPTRRRTRYLPPLARGEQLGCFCLTEPHAGSDAAAIATRAERRGDRYVLNGVKQFITTGKNADVADRVRRDRQGRRQEGHLGVHRRDRERRATSSRASRRSSASARPTPRRSCSRTARCRRRTCSAREGEGYRIALANLEAGRIGIAAQAVGMARAAFDAALALRARAARRSASRSSSTRR